MNGVMDYWRGAKDYDGGGLLGAVTPFRTTRVDCRDGCGNFGGHGTYDFNFVDTAIAHARLAGVPAELVVNTWPLARLLKWVRSR